MAFEVGPQRGGKLRPTMNVTPLVDVVLVLLIIFMVVTPLLTKQLGMTVPARPEPEEVAPPPDPLALPPVVLTLDRAGSLAINREPVSREHLVARLQRMLNARADKVVFFDAQDDVPYGSAMEVIDLARGGGIQNIAVLPDPIAQSP